MLSELKILLSQKLDGKNLTQLAKAIGYQNPNKFLEHLTVHVLNQPFLGLDHPHYDFRYSTSELILKLAEALDIPSKVVDSALYEVNIGIKLYNQHTPYLYVKTDFSIKQSTFPIFALAALESRRRISVAFEDFQNDKNAMKEILSKSIKSHYSEHNGHLEFWGNIIGYHYHHSDGSIDYWSTDGQKLEDKPIVESKAFVGIPLNL